MAEYNFEFYRTNMLNKQISDCSICLCDYQDTDKIRVTPCGHEFHSNCIKEWLMKNENCPNCRKVLDYDTLN